MPPFGIESDGDIPASGVKEGLVCLPHTSAGAAHRIPCAGEEEDWVLGSILARLAGDVMQRMPSIISPNRVTVGQNWQKGSAL